MHGLSAEVENLGSHGAANPMGSVNNRKDGWLCENNAKIRDFDKSRDKMEL